MYEVIMRKCGENWVGDWKNVSVDLKVFNFGDGDPDKYLFNTKEDAQEVYDAYVSANEEEIRLGLINVKLEESYDD